LLVIEAFVGRIAAMRADTLFLTEVGDFASPLVQPRLPREAELAVVPGGTDVVLRGRASGGGGFLLGLLIAVPVFISLSQWDWLSLGN
jgi:hypothetical protein